jgi:UDP-N-acetylglucosamine 4,6-dehydratase/5-epimerase
MKKIFITGGSGTVGKSFIKKYYKNYKFYSYARGEKAQVALKRLFPEIEIIIGGIEDLNLLTSEVIKINPDIVIHAAALKHVDTAEKQPSQAILVNVVGSYNVIQACRTANVPITVGISTDKACSPSNIYGHSKSFMEKLFLEAYDKKNKFVCCRFGNVAWSNGSVIPFWLSQKEKNKKLLLTDVKMNRLMFSEEESSELIKKCIDDSEKFDESFVLSKLMKTVNMLKLAKLISKDIDIVGLRPGEKLNEDLISEKELPYSTLKGEHVYLRSLMNNDLESRLPFKLSSENANEMSESEMKDILKIARDNSTSTLINQMNY